MSSYDDPRGVLANMGLEGDSPWQLFLGTASAVSVVNSVVGAGALAIVLGVTLHLPLAVAAAAAFVFLAASVAVHMRYDRRQHERAGARVEAIFPSPSLSPDRRAERRRLPAHVELADGPGSGGANTPRPPAGFSL
jgi:hypothetical protein